MERKLTAILSADVEGYSRLMGDDEEATIRTLTFYRQLMTPAIRGIEEEWWTPQETTCWRSSAVWSMQCSVLW